MDVSVVIPTRNRPRCLDRLLETLERQTEAPLEIVVVDSSDEPLDAAELRRRHPDLPLRCLESEPSVCLQRNLGITESRAPLVFVCDDDMELPPEYIERLRRHLVEHPETAAASGMVVEPGQSGEHDSQFRVSGVGELLYRFGFQLSIWGEVDHLEPARPLRPIYRLLERFYARRGNALSAAGWPLVTRFDHPFFRTPVWGLGASMLRREALGETPYDPVFDRHGIGENFDLCLKLPGERPVAVLTDVRVLHCKSPINRLEADLSYYRRTLTLHYFLCRYPRFGRRHRLAFLWSLLGKTARATAVGRPRRARAMLKVFALAIVGRNPYLLAHRRGDRFVRPRL